jgi:signal transduction histidine kinase/HD-like signal output (HDOD) protein
MTDKLPQIILDSVTSIQLSPLPQVLIRFLTLAEDERTSLPDMAGLVAQDPALATHILSLASCHSTLLETAGISLEQSMTRLGIPLLRTLAACLAAQHSQVHTVYARNLDYPGFWRHSLRVAALARSLATAAGYHEVEEAYLAGLLHDIGQLLLIGGLEEYADTLSDSGGNDAGLAGLTQTLSAIDHGALGVHLIDSWQLPSFMAEAVLFHRYPADQIKSANILCRIVWAAHYLSECDADIETDTDLFPEIPTVSALLGIERAAIATACEFSQRWAAERSAAFGVSTAVADSRKNDKFIYPYLSLPKRPKRDAAQLQIDALVRNQAAMQPLQQGLLSVASEAELYELLSDIARFLFGLRRPIFLLPLPDRPFLAVVGCAGQPPLLQRLEIPLEQSQNSPCQALQTQQPTSSFMSAVGVAPSLIDIQLARLLGSQGVLSIPMGSPPHVGGVMVFGLSREQYGSKQNLLAELVSFARLAAGSIESFYSLQQRDQTITADLTRLFEQKTRKVVHEASNPLGIINNYLNIFAERLGDSADAQQELTILKEEIARVGRIIRRLNAMPEPSLPVETVNVNSLIEGMLALYGESLFEARHIVIEKQLAPGLPPIQADRDSLKQILLNIWKNSSEAMPDGGNLFIGTRVSEEGNASGSVEIRLSDSGPGLPPDVKARLFKPLEPDRRPANSGLGLSIVASLVEKLGGQISCETSPKEGTTFIIRFRQAQKEIA